MIAFFCRNGVAANLLLLAIVIAGGAVVGMRKIPVEVFPMSELRSITVSVPYRGSNPEEIEESIVMRIEEAIADLEGIEEIVSTATASSGQVMVEVDDGYDVKELRDEIETRVDGIVDFPPGDAENVTVAQAKLERWTISVVLSGELHERDLAQLGAEIRDEITALPEITHAALQGVRAYEIAIEVDEDALERYGMTFAQISNALRSYSIDIPAGTLDTESGKVALRTKGRAYNQAQFEAIPLRTLSDGTRLKLGDIAKVTDGFHEDEFLARFNGERCVIIPVFREGTQSAIRIAEEVKDYISERQATLPEGVSVAYWGDSSRIVKARLITLFDSAWKSMLFVFIILTLFLRPSLGFWVMLGIPVCFLGTLALMPLFDVTVNIVSLFGFILVLGVVVDDAIVTGENVYSHQEQEGADIVQASIKGTKEVTMPVMFGVFTTMLAFVSLYFMEGPSMSWMPQIATIVISVLAFSLIESKLILPSHLTHSPRRFLKGVITFFLGRQIAGYCGQAYGVFSKVQRAFAGSLEWFVQRVFQPVLNVALEWRYAVLALFLGGMTLIIGAMIGGAVKQVKFPRVASERATCRLTMQEGTPYEITHGYIMQIEQIVEDMREEFVGTDGVSIIEDVFASAGGQGVASSKGTTRTGSSHRGEIVFYITAPEERELDIDAREILSIWRERVEEIGIVGANQLYFRAEIMRGRDPIRVELRGQNAQALADLAGQTRDKLASYQGLFDIEDSLDESRDEIQLAIRPEAEQFGLTLTDLARQVRQAFFGEEIQRLQRGRDEVRVMLKYPLKDRQSLAALESMKIRTRDGTEVPFTTVAEATVTQTPPRITRIDRYRAVTISADADKAVAKLDDVRADLSEWLDEQTSGNSPYRTVSYDFVGEARDNEESNAGIKLGALIIIFGIYAMLAIPFRSYVQPLIVMSVIPFGLIGAVLGHIIEDQVKADIGGMPVGILSFLGMLALAGVVVNDSLVLVDYINRRRRAGDTVFQAVSAAGAARFRPIILTSATTFAGLFPLIRMESTQAQFLIPMAVSLGYGILFATLITLVLVPINYLVLNDLANARRSLFEEK